MFRAVCQYRDGDGRTRQMEATGLTEAKARRRLAAAVRDRSGLRKETLTATTRLHKVAEQYFARLEGDQRSPNTIRLYRSAWAHHIEPRAGLWMIREATNQAVDQLLVDLRAGLSGDLTKTCRQVLSGVLAVAVRADVLPVNPVANAAPVRGVRRAPVRALAPGQAVDLWERLVALAATEAAAVNGRHYRRTMIDPDLPDLVLWMLGTSDRIGNALAVHWPQVDLDEAVAHLGPNVIRVTGEGLRLNEGTSKTREAVVDLPEPLVVMLLARRQRATNLVGPVFPDALGGLRDPSNTSHDLKDALALAGYGWCTSHVFRKTVATVLDDAGLSARHVADQLRHARPSMTLDRYMRRGARNPRAKAALEAMLGCVASSGTVTELRPAR